MNFEGTPIPSMVCGTCSRPLWRTLPKDDSGALTGEIIYHHPLHIEADHEPVPQPRAEHYEDQINQVCDFCTSRSVKWRYRAPGIQIHALDHDDQPIQEQQPTDEWNACEVCAKYIQHRNSEGLLRRALPAFGPDPDEFLIAMVRGLHQAFFHALQPGRTRVTGDRT
ncbi:hypothetical protein [Glycomyces xiaoerkulensis]|uniref:hypothetical protein n=1 Tax=Glycomyces xiaoerkulensis TaxID=2038139 RepID=UPI000C26ABA3|nr:hypothetical protein [Glycomyces xiaoerkulensis]